MWTDDWAVDRETGDRNKQATGFLWIALSCQFWRGTGNKEKACARTRKWNSNISKFLNLKYIKRCINSFLFCLRMRKQTYFLCIFHVFYLFPPTFLFFLKIYLCEYLSWRIFLWYTDIVVSSRKLAVEDKLGRVQIETIVLCFTKLRVSDRKREIPILLFGHRLMTEKYEHS